MKSTNIAYEGRITEVNQIFRTPQHVKFKLSDQDIEFVAGVEHITSLDPGDRVYAVCRIDSDGKAIVVDLLRRKLNEAISEAEKTALLNRLGVSLSPPMGEASGDTVKWEGYEVPNRPHNYRRQDDWSIYLADEALSIWKLRDPDGKECPGPNLPVDRIHDVLAWANQVIAKFLGNQ